jgi:hypothetical protein
MKGPGRIAGQGRGSIENGVTLLAIAGVFVLTVFAGGSAEACSVCISASEETRVAYYVTTVIMMAFPFLCLGGLVFWLARAARIQRKAQEAALASPH